MECVLSGCVCAHVCEHVSCEQGDKVLSRRVCVCVCVHVCVSRGPCPELRGDGRKLLSRGNMVQETQCPWRLKLAGFPKRVLLASVC